MLLGRPVFKRRKIFKWIFEKWHMRVWIGLAWLKVGSHSWLYELNNAASGSVVWGGGRILDFQRNHNLFKEDFTAWSQFYAVLLEELYNSLTFYRK